MGGILAVLYGVFAYVAFLVTFAYAIAFIGNIIVPKTIDSGTPGPLLEALIVNVVLLGVFAVQHSVMARQGFKRLVDPHRAESGRAQHLRAVRNRGRWRCCCWQWRPMPDVIWSVTEPDRSRRDPRPVLARLGHPAAVHVPAQSLRAVRLAPGAGAADGLEDAGAAVPHAASSTSASAIRSISASSSASGRRRR